MSKSRGRRHRRSGRYIGHAVRPRTVAGRRLRPRHHRQDDRSAGRIVGAGQPGLALRGLRSHRPSIGDRRWVFGEIQKRRGPKNVGHNRTEQEIHSTVLKSKLYIMYFILESERNVLVYYGFTMVCGFL